MEWNGIEWNEIDSDIGLSAIRSSASNIMNAEHIEDYRSFPFAEESRLQIELSSS
jgi:hypothetical protein